MQKILDKNPETCLYKDPSTVFFIPALTFQKFNDCVDLKHWKLLSWSFLQHKEKKPLKILLKSWKMKLFFSSVFLQKIFVSFPFTCHKACTFTKLRLFFQLIGSQKLVPHVPSQQFLLGTKAIYLWRTEFTVICVYHFPLFLHCFQLGSFKYSSCHTHHFQFTCYAKTTHSNGAAFAAQFVQILYSRPEILIHLQTRCSLNSISSCITGILMHRIETRFWVFSDFHQK